MAGIALGGVQLALRSTKARLAACAHRETLSTISSGVERLVCERCGHLSIRIDTALSGPLDRDRFARPADELETIASRGSSETHVRLPSAGRYGFGLTGTDVFAHRPHAQTASLSG